MKHNKKKSKSNQLTVIYSRQYIISCLNQTLQKKNMQWEKTLMPPMRLIWTLPHLPNMIPGRLASVLLILDIHKKAGQFRFKFLFSYCYVMCVKLWVYTTWKIGNMFLPTAGVPVSFNALPITSCLDEQRQVAINSPQCFSCIWVERLKFLRGQAIRSIKTQFKLASTST